MKGNGNRLPLLLTLCLVGVVGCNSDYDQVTQAPSANPDLIADAKGNLPLCNDLLHSLGTQAALQVCTNEAQSGDATAQFTLANLYLDGTFAKEDWQQAMPWIILAANQGHLEAQMVLATCLQQGKGVTKNEQQAVHWLEQAAKGNHERAQVALGVCYKEGKGVEKNEATAIKWFADCAKKGNTEATYQLALMHLTPGVSYQPDEAQNLLLMASEKGHGLSMLTLGRLYREGTVLTKDDSKALYWYAQANAQRHPEAQYELAMLVLNGVWKMNEDPIELLQQSAEQQYVPAQLALAKIYQEGQKVPRNDHKAFEWYLAAAKQGDPQAYCQIGLCFIHGQLSQPKNRDLGAEYLKQSADLEYMPAQYTLASLYLEGIPVLENRKQAMDYLMQAANAGWTDAQLKLAESLIQFSLPQYDKAAFHWLQKASQHQHLEALYQLANCYYEGIGTTIDYGRAMDIYKNLAVREHMPSHFKLGKMLFDGQGVEKNSEEARKWFEVAARHKDEDAKQWLKLFFNETDESLAANNIEGEINEWLPNTIESPPDMYQQGLNYLYAKHGFAQNIQAGINFLQAAAEKEYIPAQRELAIIEQQRLFGYENSEHPAQEWYLRAAKNGDSFSQLQIAKMYYQGAGVDRNIVQAYAFANMAALQGVSDASVLSSEIVTQLNDNELAVADMIVKTMEN